MSNVNKNGNIIIDSGYSLLVSDFVEKKAASGWSIDSPTYNTGYTSITGTSPGVYSPTFNVGADDIITVEMSLYLSTVSTTTSGPGIYLGTKNGQSTTLYGFNFSTNTWSSGSSSTNPYFINGYNSTNTMSFKSYILGKNVDINSVPEAYRSINTHGISAIKLTSDTSTNIRTGYNTNTSMVINFTYMRVYKYHGIHEESDVAGIGNGYINTNYIIEY